MLTDKEKKALAKYKHDFALPKWKYILINGLSFGIFIFITNISLDFLADKKSIEEIFQKKLWLSLLAALAAGIVYGFTLRWIYLREYNKLKYKEKAVKAT